MRDQILLVAGEVRAWAEKQAVKFGFPSDLQGLCAIASAKLFSELKKLNLPGLVIAANRNHCFVRVGALIVDVTATQFKREPIMVIQLSELPEGDSFWWQASHTFKSRADLYRWQVKTGWPEEQTVKSRAKVPT